MASLHEHLPRVGVDAGTLFLKVVATDGDGATIIDETVAHSGDPRHRLGTLLASRGVTSVGTLGVTGALADTITGPLGIEPVDDTSALMAAMRSLGIEARNIMDIGGGSLNLVTLGADGSFLGSYRNSLCASGTGSFLDEQRERLSLDRATLDGAPTVAEPPTIAARCAVFAKSDLIHRQQEGFDRIECWSGLCRGVVGSAIQTLFRGRPIAHSTLLVGGVVQEPEVRRWLQEAVGEHLMVADEPMTFKATGALAKGSALDNSVLARLTDESVSSSTRSETRRPPLALDKTKYPSFEVDEEYLDDEGTEVRVHDLPRGASVRGYLGIDIGSTSTKALLIDEARRPVVDLYRKTAGDPIGATKKVLRGITALFEARGATVDIAGVGTTGSGRKLVGAVIGADRVINEISAHVAGAMHVDPSVDTIFEIGGQDAKYVHTRHGRLHDSTMNYVCAAGTGSFVEEQARKLGFDVREVGDQVMGLTPPITSDRCTVFMEQDAQALIRQGYSPAEVMAAVMYSVVQNYLNKVVGTRYRSGEKIFFQGATARNKGLVAAFENLLGVEMVVSPLCHVMGSLGVALLTADQMSARQESTGWAGMGFVDREVTLGEEICDLCANKCRITRATIAGMDSSPSWGYLCGRDPDETAVRRDEGYTAFEGRRRAWRHTGGSSTKGTRGVTIGLPRALLNHTYYPFWQTFLEDLGFSVKLSPGTTPPVVADALEWVGADYCFPVKLAHGHVRRLVEDDSVDLVLMPFMISAAHETDLTSASRFCPYNIALPAIIESAMGLRGVAKDKLLDLVCDLRWAPAKAAERIHDEIGARFGLNKGRIKAAWQRAVATQAQFGEANERAGEELLRKVEEAGETAVVVMGRPYNVHDEGANLAIPKKLARLGFTVIPMDLLPLDDIDPGPLFENMYWEYGRKILQAATFVAGHPNLRALYLTNFSCGPDSFVLSYVEEIMGSKPMLILELDEHGADAGYITRLEAFADVLASSDEAVAAPYEPPLPPDTLADVDGKILWIPPMQEAAAPMFAAALRANGFDAKHLPIETQASYDLGRSTCRGTECVPCPATFGTFLDTIAQPEHQDREHALFMPTASGPCRFGQYKTLDRIILNRLGKTDVPIVSWTSENTYYGLDMKARKLLWDTIVVGDVLLKMRCKVRPAELTRGDADEAYDIALGEICQAFEEGRRPVEEVTTAAKRFLAVPQRTDPLPVVGIVGEIYVRSNPFTSQDLIGVIEASGGRAWLTPISEWILYTAYMETWKLREQSAGFFSRAVDRLYNRFLSKSERFWYDRSAPLLDDMREPSVDGSVELGKDYFPVDYEGEAIITIGRALEFVEGGAAMVVNCAPFGCMPGTLTSGILQQIQEETGVPMVSQFYDGERSLNGIITTILANLDQSKLRSRARAGR